MGKQPELTIEEKILQLMDSVDGYPDGIRLDIEELKKDDPEGSKTAGLTERLESLTGLPDVYMRSIETLVGRKLYSSVEIRRIHDRLDALEDAALNSHEKRQTRKNRTSRRRRVQRRREIARNRMLIHLLHNQ